MNYQAFLLAIFAWLILALVVFTLWLFIVAIFSC